MKLTIQAFIGFCVAAASFTAAAQVSYTWIDVTPPNPPGPYPLVNSFAVHPLDGRRLIVARGDGLLRASADSGATWDAPVTTPGGPQRIDRVFAHPGQPGVLFLQVGGLTGLTPFTARVYFRGPTYRSDDFGLSWTLIHEPSSDTELPISPFATDPFDVNHIFATRRELTHCLSFFGCSSPGDLSVVQSRDGGRTWSAPGQGLSSRIEDTLTEPTAQDFGDSNVTGPTPAAPSRLILTTQGTSYVSRDSGTSWRAIPPPTPVALSWVRPDPRRANVLFAQSGVGGNAWFLRSDDEGVTWHDVFAATASSNIYGMVTVDPLRSREVWLTGLVAGVHRSTDGGDSWSPVGLAADIVPTYAGDLFVNSNTIPRRLVVSPADPGVVYVMRGDRLYRGVPSVRPDLIAVEFQYEADRYWVTALDGEALFLDYRREPGNIRRTGERFGLWRADNAPPGAIGSCRFWSKPESGLRTRVLMLQGPECEGLKRVPGWTLEAENEFFAMPPTRQDGCEGGLVPVWRLNNRKPDLNHRYVVSPRMVAETQARGWQLDGLAMCARPLRSEE